MENDKITNKHALSMAIEELKNTQKHTKGPWRISSFGAVLGSDTTGTTICDINEAMLNSGFSHVKSEAEANAKLIAAAPELLKALELMVNNYEKYKSNGAENQALLKAIAAINKTK